MISAAQCSEIVRAYDQQGWHRTGSAVDNDSGEWLVREMQARGVAAELDSFPFTRVDSDPCRVWAGDWQVDGQPMPDGLLPPSGTTLTGVFADSPDMANFALVRIDQHGQSALLDTLSQQPWKAVVAAVEGTTTGLTLRNAWHYDEPRGAPIIQVPASVWERLNAIKEQRVAVNASCGATRSDVTASNVVARVSGSQPSLPPVVVLTPRSGWWNCAGERGGGIAVWLEVARHVRALGLKRDTVFLATTGHELGFIGIQRYLDHDPGLAPDALLWIHLGANIGALESPTVVRSPDESLLRTIQDLERTKLESRFQPEFVVTPQPPGGEAVVVAGARGKYVSLVGRSFSLFHSSEDRWPRATDAEAIALNGRLVLELIQRLDTIEPEQLGTG